MRLRQLTEQFRDRVEITHRAFILLAEDQKRTFTPYYLQHRRAARQMTGLPYDLPPVGAHYPLSSMASLEASKWVEANHPEQFRAYDLALYEAFFQHTRDISDTTVLVELAQAQGLPGEALAEALGAHAFREAVWADHRAALEAAVTSIPTVVMGPYAVSGAVPYEDYEQVARALLEGGGGDDPAAKRAPRRPLIMR